MRHPTQLAIITSLGLAVFLLGGCGPAVGLTPAYNYTPAAAQPGQAGQPEIVATVNGQPITMEAFNRERARFEAARAALGLDMSKADEQQVLDLLVEQELIRQEAARQGVYITDATVDAEIDSMKQTAGNVDFEAWLQSNYYVLAEFREVIRLELATGALITPVAQSVPTVAEHVHARHILVDSQERAMEILARIRAGEDFAALAAEYSVDVSTRSNGGDLGWFPRGGLLVPQVEEAAFRMQPNEISDVIASAWGFHIVQTLGFDPAREIDPETRQRLVRQAIDNWRLGLRDGADIQQFISLTS